MGLQEKLQVARQLARLKVDIIEAGFPIASPGDFDAVDMPVATQIKGPTICGLARCLPKDIDRAAEALGARGKTWAHPCVPGDLGDPSSAQIEDGQEQDH